jgi:hypothetical protein
MRADVKRLPAKSAENPRCTPDLIVTAHVLGPHIVFDDTVTDVVKEHIRTLRWTTTHVGIVYHPGSVASSDRSDWRSRVASRPGRADGAETREQRQHFTKSTRPMNYSVQ